MPKRSEEFDKGKKAGPMRLESVMVAGNAYTIRELEKLTGRTYTRIAYKLKQLQRDEKAECQVVDHVTYWRLTSTCYLDGSVKERPSKKKGRSPGRPSEWAVSQVIVVRRPEFGKKKKTKSEKGEKSKKSKKLPPKKTT